MTAAVLLILTLAVYTALLRLRNQRLAAEFKSLLYLCQEVADFSNGNTHDGFDEGCVMAGRMIDDARKRTGIYKYDS